MLNSGVPYVTVRNGLLAYIQEPRPQRARVGISITGRRTWERGKSPRNKSASSTRRCCHSRYSLVAFLLHAVRRASIIIIGPRISGHGTRLRISRRIAKRVAIFGRVSSRGRALPSRDRQEDERSDTLHTSSWRRRTSQFAQLTIRINVRGKIRK